MERKKLSTSSKVAVLGAAMGLSFLAGYGYTHHRNAPVGTLLDAHAAAVTSTSGNAPAEQPRLANITLPDFSEIVARQGAAVVNISVAGTIKTGFARLPNMQKADPNDPFSEFFRRFQMPLPRGDVPTQGQGSGFIVSADGMVLTNAHVVADAEEVIVKLIDKREFKAKVIGLDKPSDVAVLKIDAKNLPVVRIGDPKMSRVGEWVIAIGSPFGFENSVTAGIISAQSRSLPAEGYVPFLQTDVAINPGNSGGPLFNLNGEVIGINSQIYSQSGGYQGLSFAIPIDVAMKVERQLVDHGKVSRGRLGVVIQEVNQQLADSFGLDKAAGALVNSVEKNSPADQAGLEPGDVILKFNGNKIDRSSDLPALVADVTPGSKTTVQIWRKNNAKDITVSVGELKTGRGKEKTGSNDIDNESSKTKLGLRVRPLNADERKEAEVASGLVVEDVDSGPAARAGVRPGDVILSVNGEKVASAEQLRALIEKKDKHIALQVLREDRKIFVPIKIS